MPGTVCVFFLPVYTVCICFSESKRQTCFYMVVVKNQQGRQTEVCFTPSGVESDLFILYFL